MECLTEIRDILLQIIAVATLNIRRAGNSGDASRCAVEADHIHNLPALVAEYRPELLDFYWNSERVSFLNQAGESGIDQFKPICSKMQSYMRNQNN